MKKGIVRALFGAVCTGGLLLAACSSGSVDSGNKMFAPGGVVLEEPVWARDINVVYGGKDLDISQPGTFGYYEEDGEYATVYDADGIPFRFKKGSIKRVINLWPSNTSGMLALGAEDFFVARLGTGMTPWQEVMFPRYANLETRIQPGAGADNAEALMKLNPDVIIGMAPSITNLRSLEYEGRKLPVVNVYFRNYQEMKATFRVVGKLLGGRVEQNGDNWGKMLQANIDRVAKGLRRTPVRPVIYYDARGVGNSAGSGGSINSTIGGGGNRAGGATANAGGGAAAFGATAPSGGTSVVMNEWTSYAGGKYWPEVMRLLRQEHIVSQTGVNMEMILRYPPQKIFVGGGRRPESEAFVTDLDPATNPWAGVVADIGQDNINFIPFVLWDWGRFGAESAMQVLWAAVHIHPEIFADPDSPDYIDIRKETRDFYTDFVGYPLSEAELERILNAQLPVTASAAR